MPSDEQTTLVQQVSMAFRSTDTNVKREALDMLLRNFHSPDPNIRQECVKQLHRLFPQFPDLKENCINSVYDACEDPDPDVRKEGYRAISRFSESDNSLVRRNADVLVQLLQSEEPGELEVIKTSLALHFRTDASATIQVLCDSCLPGPADREQLRGLVLDFLTTPPSASSRRDMRSISGAAELLMFTELSKAIPYCTPHQTHLVIQLLATTQTVAKSSELSNMLIGSLSDRIDREVEMKKLEQIDMPSFMPFVVVAGTVAQKLLFCDPLPVFQRLCNRPLRRLSSLVPPNLHISRPFMTNLFNIASRYTKLKHTREEALPTLDLLIDESPPLLPIMLSPPVMWQEISILLQAISDRSKRSGWRLTRAHIDALQTVQAQVGVDSGSPAQAICADLLKRVLPPSKPRSSKANEKGGRISFVNAAQKSESLSRRINPPKRKLEEEPHSQNPPTRPASAPSLASRLGLQHSTQPADIRPNRISTDQQPPMKRMKENATPLDSSSSSLLARIQDGAKQWNQDGPLGNAPSSGFKIKGAGATQRLEDRMAHH